MGLAGVLIWGGLDGKHKVPKIVKDFMREAIRCRIRRKSPRSGKIFRKLPPAKSTTRRTANKKAGMALPRMTAALVHVSK
jgi:hypothetical protein